MTKTILIYDGDSLSFRASAAIETRKVRVTSIKSGKSKVFKTKTEHKNLVQDNDIVYDKSNYTFEEIRESLPAQFGKNIVDKQIREINDRLFADEYLVCLSGKTNFRDTLPLPTKYKGARDDLIRPEYLKELKTHLWRKHPSLLAQNREADDDLIIKGYEYLDKGYTVILVQQDKDAWAYSGLSLYDYTQDNPQIITIPEFGQLDLEHRVSGKQKIVKVKGKGFLWFCFQWLNGDITDNYKPCELAKVKFGEKSAYDLLVNCRTEQEALQVVVDQYRKWYPSSFTYIDWQGRLIKSDYAHMLDLYLKCARMMTHENDQLHAREFLESKGIDID